MWIVECTASSCRSGGPTVRNCGPEGTSGSGGTEGQPGPEHCGREKETCGVRGRDSQVCVFIYIYGSLSMIRSIYYRMNVYEKITWEARE